MVSAIQLEILKHTIREEEPLYFFMREPFVECPKI